MEKRVYAPDGVYMVGDDNAIQRLVLQEPASSWEEECAGHALLFDKSWWRLGETAYHLPLDYTFVEVKREKYSLPTVPSVTCVVESRNGDIVDMYYSCKSEVPITSIAEDIGHFAQFFQKHCVGNKS
jgi:hypothetical protein